MNARACLLIAALAVAAASAWLPRPRPPSGVEHSAFPGWPHTFEGEPLEPMGAGPQDVWFTRDFPGKVARFSARHRQVVIRWVNAPTRRLHPAGDCFAGAGYTLEHRPMQRLRSGPLMSCFAARKGNEVLHVCEHLRNYGAESWPDVSSWYWSALVAPAGAAWWSYVVVEREL